MIRGNWTRSCSGSTWVMSKPTTKPWPAKPPNSSARMSIIWRSSSTASSRCARCAASSDASGTPAFPSAKPSTTSNGAGPGKSIACRSDQPRYPQPPAPLTATAGDLEHPHALHHSLPISPGVITVFNGAARLRHSRPSTRFRIAVTMITPEEPDGGEELGAHRDNARTGVGRRSAGRVAGRRHRPCRQGRI